MKFAITMLMNQKIVSAPNKNGKELRQVPKGATFVAVECIGDYFAYPSGGWVSLWKGKQKALTFAPIEPPIDPPPPAPERLPVSPYPLGIIKMRTDPLQRENDPQTLAMMDYPSGSNKGHTIHILRAMYDYLKKIQSAKAHAWLFRPQTMMTNKPHEWDGTGNNDPCMFENIGLPCNFVAMMEFTITHARVVSRLNTADLSTLDPAWHNWEHMPTEFWKATMRNADGRVFKVGSGLDVYTMVVRQLPGLWIPLRDVERFPTLPMVVTYEGTPYTIDGYCVKGNEVYGHTADFDVPLRTVGKDGLQHPCPEWTLITPPVPS